MAGLVTISCPNCPRQLQIRPEYVGRKVSCKFCTGAFRVPRHTLFSCPKCLREGMVRTEYLGRKVRCKACSQVFRARSKDAPGQTGAALEVKRLAAELARRESELVDLRDRLDEAHNEVVNLDEKARTLTDQRDYGQRTQEWSVVEEDTSSSSPELANGAESDLALAELDALTHLEPGVIRPPDLTKTRLAEPGESLESLREECSRLREELDNLRENAERTVITRDQTEILERDLQVAKADNVRLSAEQTEIRHAAEELMKLVHEQKIALLDLARGRDESRAAFELAEAARLALAEELEARKAGHFS